MSMPSQFHFLAYSTGLIRLKLVRKYGARAIYVRLAIDSLYDTNRKNVLRPIKDLHGLPQCFFNAKNNRT